MLIRQFGDPVLREQTRPVTDFGPELDRLIDKMVETMEEAPGVGLAATQVGVALRLFVYDSGNGPQALVNPVIIEGTGEQIEEEGCLSVPEIRLQVPRYDRIVVQAQDRHGTPVEIELHNLEARIFQHEIDHLDGLLILDRVPPQDRRQAMRELNEKAGLI